MQLTWPHNNGAWLTNFDQVEACFTWIAREIARREKLLVACQDSAHLERVIRHLQNAGTRMDQVRLYVAPSDDVWARDHGPITVVAREGATLLDFHFNGWGGKYPAERDDAITRRLAEAGAYGQANIETLPLVLEGGALDTDGMGTLLTTERCLLAPTRNPDLNKASLEAELHRSLGIERVLWLTNGGLAGDDTDGHVDTLARFCDDTTIVYQSCQRPEDEHYVPLKAMAEELAAFHTPEGQPYRLMALPLPKAIYNRLGERLPLSYANFLIINEAVLMPVYDDAADIQAQTVLASCFPGREIIPINCRVLTEQYGSLHCVTMQIPEEVPLL